MGCSGLGPRLGALAAVALWSGACASTTTAQIGSLTAEGRANPLRAHAAHRDQRFRVSALVVSTGLKKVRTLHGTTEAVGIEMGRINLTSGEFTAREGSRGYPYLLARDPRQGEAGGELLCFFQPEELDNVAMLDLGTNVTVEGDFQEYSKGGARVVLNLCEIR